MSDNNVVPVDFGKDYNESARRLGRLMGLAEKQQAEIAANPKKFLDEAHDQIVALRREMRRLTEVRSLSCIRPAMRSDAMPCLSERVTVMKDDYDRWTAGDEVVRDWFARGLV